MLRLKVASLLLVLARLAYGLPKPGFQQPFDIQGHRGGRGNVVESTLPAFAWGLINGVNTLEMDNGITKDGVVVVWHDENLVPEKCRDTAPAFDNDPFFPYVGKFIANLTIAQLKTVDCGALRLDGFPLQLTYPHTPISSLQEVLDFVACVDPQHTVKFNIESKIDPVNVTQTRGVEDFVKLQYQIFAASPYKSAITYQSFDWRTLISMHKLDKRIPLAALADDTTTLAFENSTSPWLGGLSLDSFPGANFDTRLCQAAKSIGASILSPAATSTQSLSLDPHLSGYVSFTTKEMVSSCHALGLNIKPWTVDRLDIVEQLLQFGLGQDDGIISDYPDVLRRYFINAGISVAPSFSERRVLRCLKEHAPTA